MRPLIAIQSKEALGDARWYVWLLLRSGDFRLFLISSGGFD
jgi:hypothetical protein